jgi:hypothetical protein
MKPTVAHQVWVGVSCAFDPWNILETVESGQVEIAVQRTIKDVLFDERVAPRYVIVSITDLDTL